MAPYTVPSHRARRDPVMAPLLAEADGQAERGAAAPTAAPVMPGSPAAPARNPRTTSSPAFKASVARNNAVTQDKAAAYAITRQTGGTEAEAGRDAYAAGRRTRRSMTMAPGGYGDPAPAPSAGVSAANMAPVMDPREAAANTRTNSSPNFLDSLARDRQEQARRAGNRAMNAGMDNLALGDTPTRPQGSGRARIVTADGEVHERQFTPAPVETHAQLGRRQMQNAAGQFGRQEEEMIRRGLDPLPRELAVSADARLTELAGAEVDAEYAEGERRRAQGGLYQAQAGTEEALRDPTAKKLLSEAYKNEQDPSVKLAEGRAELAEQALTNQQRLTDDQVARDRLNRGAAPKPSTDTTMRDLQALHNAATSSGDMELANDTLARMQEHLSARNAAPVPEAGDSTASPPERLAARMSPAGSGGFDLPSGLPAGFMEQDPLALAQGIGGQSRPAGAALKPMTPDVVERIKRQAGGNKQRAIDLAMQQGYDPVVR